MGADPRDWIRRGVVYQIYPRSYADSNGDGVGDLAGIIEHLDHLADPDAGLGVDAIWLSPIYLSPMLDGGYDISDYSAIDPVFGSLADFDRLVGEAHRRGIRVMLDLVMNHTSDRHPWFEASRSSRDGDFADWYLWADPAGRARSESPRPPNGLRSFFGGPAWQWDPRRGQFYFHTFLPEQPDVNWRNPALRDAMWSMVRGWLDRGVDGFRLDVFTAFVKAADLAASDRRSRAGASARHRGHRYDLATLASVLRQFRSIVEERPGAATVGELFNDDVHAAVPHWEPHHLVFDWELIETPWSAAAFRRTIAAREAAWGERWPTVVLSNHDQSRHVSRYLRRFRERSPATVDALAKAAATIELTLRGTPFLYAGEELGTRDVAIPPERIQDGAAFRRKGWWNRDQCRAPIAWTGGRGLGFTDGDPWLPLPDDGATRNVAAQRADSGSVLSHYRRLLQLRRSNDALADGDLTLVDVADDDVLAYARSAGRATLLVAVRFNRRAGLITLPPFSGGWRPILSSAGEPATPAGGRLRLGPLEAVILEAR
jgi:alpha-glucosidase